MIIRVIEKNKDFIVETLADGEKELHIKAVDFVFLVLNGFFKQQTTKN